MKEVTLGPTHFQVGTLLAKMGDLARQREAPREAIALYEKALPMVTLALGEGHAEVGALYGGLGIALAASAASEEVISRHRVLEASVAAHTRALDVLRGAYGRRHSEVGSAMTNLGNARMLQGRMGEAAACYEEALSIKEDTLGPADAEVALTLSNLATVRVQQGRASEAAELYERALAIQSAPPASRPALVAGTMGSLGRALSKLARFDDAEEAYVRALALVGDGASAVGGLEADAVRQGLVASLEGLRAMRAKGAGGEPNGSGSAEPPATPPSAPAPWRAMRAKGAGGEAHGGGCVTPPLAARGATGAPGEPDTSGSMATRIAAQRQARSAARRKKNRAPGSSPPPPPSSSATKLAAPSPRAAAPPAVVSLSEAAEAERDALQAARARILGSFWQMKERG